MKVIIHAYFATPEQKESWKQSNEESIARLLPRMSYKMRDTPDPECYNGAELIYKPGTKYRTIVRTYKHGETIIEFTDVETATVLIVTYNMLDPNIVSYEIRVCE